MELLIFGALLMAIGVVIIFCGRRQPEEPVEAEIPPEIASLTSEDVMVMSPNLVLAGATFAVAGTLLCLISGLVFLASSLS